jgi:hypothetical protein
LREFITLTNTRRADHWELEAGFFVVLPLQYYLVWIQPSRARRDAAHVLDRFRQASARLIVLGVTVRQSPDLDRLLQPTGLFALALD